MDVEVLKGVQAQIAFLTQRDELKKVGAVRPYPLEWDSVTYPPKFKPPTLHTYVVRARQTSTSTTSGLRPVML